MPTRILTPLARGVRPVEPMLDLYREFNRLFEDMVSLSPMNALAGATLTVAPRLDVRETADELCVTADVPGVRPEDLDVRLEGDMLTISGEKRSESAPAGQESVHLSERSYGRFQRVLQLPFVPEAGDVQAQFAHGVLTLRVPKRDAAQRSHRIEVKVATAPSSSPQSEGTSAPSNVPPASLNEGDAGGGPASQRTH